jgi:hypothetical protein
MIKLPGVNSYKQVELYYKFCPVVPAEYHLDEFYIKPPDEVLRNVEGEGSEGGQGGCDRP